MTDIPLRRLSELRAAIEGFGARYAAARAARDANQVSALRAILRRLTSALRRGDYAAFRDADCELHATVMAMADVPHLEEVWLTVWKGLLSFHRQGFGDCVPNPRVLIGEHDHLVDTIARGDPSAAEDAARCHIEASWFRMTKNNDAAQAQSSGPFHRAAAHLTSHLHCAVRLAEVAREVACTSPRNLSRLFRQHCGRGFQQYVQELRMRKAAELLCTTRLPVATIARRVGYRDVSRFGEHFRRQFRVQPSRFRKQQSSGQGEATAAPFRSLALSAPPLTTVSVQYPSQARRLTA